uniref:Uncharacterized protein LOC110192989 isoform X2 n=1 Tax=Phascolarctos cinereus TaxID=38626 RepID=A0A6P5INB2_PHACI|nr:uncharacterized protein LOC110192989 isoform X2 [Phascolarctos cinereus]
MVYQGGVVVVAAAHARNDSWLAGGHQKWMALLNAQSPRHTRSLLIWSPCPERFHLLDLFQGPLLLQGIPSFYSAFPGGLPSFLIWPTIGSICPESEAISGSPRSPSTRTFQGEREKGKGFRVQKTRGWVHQSGHGQGFKLPEDILVMSILSQKVNRVLGPTTCRALWQAPGTYRVERSPWCCLHLSIPTADSNACSFSCSLLGFLCLPHTEGTWFLCQDAPSVTNFPVMGNPKAISH